MNMQIETLQTLTCAHTMTGIIMSAEVSYVLSQCLTDGRTDRRTAQRKTALHAAAAR